MRQMAIIGNAPIQEDWSEVIDACDLVIRFNEANNYGSHSGHRADILCICNGGAPAKQMIDGRTIRNVPFYGKLSEVWFARNSTTKRDEFTDELVRANELSDLTIHQFSGELNETVFQKLKERSLQSFVCASTGFLAIEYILSEPRFVGYEKILIGFSFQGWRGHPWETEERIVQEYVDTRSDFRMIPSAKNHSSWKDKLEKLKYLIMKN